MLRPMANLRLGVVADVQFGERDAVEERDYPGALDRCARVVRELKAQGCTRLLQLGDLIDGMRDDPEASQRQLGYALKVLAALDLPLLHVVGNHCLRAGRAEVLAALDLPRGYASQRVGGWRLLRLDTCEAGTHGRKPDDPVAAWARGWLEEHDGEERARPWNSAVSSEQLDWLAVELANAREPILVCGHHPLVPGAARDSFLCWNGEEVAQVLGEGGAVAYLCGHDHRGGMSESGGVVHWTLPAVLVGAHGAWLELTSECIRVGGLGDVTEHVFPVRGNTT